MDNTSREVGSLGKSKRKFWDQEHCQKQKIPVMRDWQDGCS